MVFNAPHEKQKMDGREKDHLGIVAKVGEASLQIGKTTNPLPLQPRQQTTGRPEDAGIEIQMFGGSDHAFWPISQFTYM